MSFFDKFKKTAESQNSATNSSNDEIIDKTTPADEIRTFEYLDDLIHGGVKEIVLDSDIVLIDSEEPQYLEGIKLDVDGLVIDGNGKTIDAKGKTRIFLCRAKNITIKNIALKNGFANQNGGAIINENGQLKIIKTLFAKNTAQNGGAIYNEGELDMSDCEFRKNTACHQFTGEGGAIKNYGNLTIAQSSFIQNTANNKGGALSNSQTMLVDDSTFMDNGVKKISGGGAAINNGKYLKILNCEISKNNAMISVIENADFLEIHQSTFKSNQARWLINNWMESNLSIFKGEFFDNSVGECVIFNNGKSCTLEKVILKSNASSENSNNIINQSELTLISPKIIDGGKTIQNEGHIFIKNSPNDFKSKIFGDGIVDVDTEVISQMQNFDFGYLDRKIHNSNDLIIHLDEDIRLENYERDFYEGGLELDIDNLIIDGNGKTIDAADKSRIFLITGNNITLRNITFKNGRSHKNYDNPLNDNGGLLKINSNINLTIENCEFANGMSEGLGGAIYASSGILNIKSAGFFENDAEYGGSIYNDKCSITILDSKLSANQSKKDGGAIFNDEGELIIEKSAFESNTSNGSGGAIMCKSTASLNIENSLFSQNVAEAGGGAINSFANGKLKIFNSRFLKNSSNSRFSGGGAIQIWGSGCDLSVKKSIFKENTSEMGGAIYNWTSKLSIASCLFKANASNQNGGAILLRNPAGYESEDCTFTDNEPDDVYKRQD